MKNNKRNIRLIIPIICCVVLMGLSLSVHAADVITNGSFDTDISGWLHNGSNGAVSFDNVIFGNLSGSMKNQTNVGRNVGYIWADSQYISTSISSSDAVTLSLYWYKYAEVVDASIFDVSVDIIKPDLTTATIWTEVAIPTAGSFLDGTVTNLDVASFFDQSGNYYFRIYGNAKNGNSKTAFTQFNIDDIVLDVVGAANSPPVVTDIPDQTIAEGASFTTITLDNYVSDPDNTDAEMTWSYSGNTELIVDITNRIATITAPNVDWNGAETITFRATDPGALWDEDPALFTITAQNDPPVVTDIPNQTIAEGASFTTITLDNYVSDVDNTDAEMTWTYSGNSELTIDITARVATITIPNADWNGAETITFRATDPGLLWDEDPALFTVTAQNDPPIVTDIPNQTIAEGASFTTITLDNYVSDVDNSDAEMTWTYTGNTELIVDITSRIATITTPNADWNGAETITFRATDPGLLWDEDPALFTVTAQNDPPVVTDIPNQTIAEGASFTTITLDNYVSDVDNTDAEMIWSYSGNTELIVDITNRIATITTPSPTWTGAETITFRATDPGLLWDEDAALFTVTPQNDPPIVTNIPGQTIAEGGSFTTITLDNYVSDVDNSDAEMTWTYSGNTGLLVDITNRIATITTPNANWNGAETITFRATDPGLLWDEDPALFTVTAQNDAPTIVASATVVSLTPVNRTDAETTTFSALFTDVDLPGVGAFNVTFKVKDISESEYILVNNLTNGIGGLTITDGGGGNYTASYTWDPSVGQALGTYDLYFEVSDGTANAIDGYAANAEELTVTETLPNNAPTVTADATVAAPNSVNRWSTNTTTISTAFADSDVLGVGAFNVTFKVKDVSEAEYTLVNNLTNGNGGLTISDGGGGNYTASYTWDPGAGQALGTYDLYFEVSDGADNVIDGYVINADELTITETIPNNAPTVTADATVAAPVSVNRVGSNTTTISTAFADSDVPGVGAFTCTFKIKDDTETELTLVNNLAHGAGGSYTASYTYNPDDAQNLGNYNLYFEVSDGTDNAIDAYADNNNELNIYQQIAPTIVADAIIVSKATVARIGTDNVTISCDFTDLDQPVVGSFTATFKVKDVGESELILVNNLAHGAGGLTIIDNSGGSYTASYNWNPGDAQTLGLYDLYFEINDGLDNAIDGYLINADELTVLSNNPPTVVSDATQVSVSPVNRLGSATTVISTVFNDIDDPGISAFFVTFKLREPDNIQELTLVNNLQHGAGGLTIIDNGGGSYTASYTYNPDDAQAIGWHDLYFEVSDGSDNAIDGYTLNGDELYVAEIVSNEAPTIVTGNTSATPSSIERAGAITTSLSVTFTDNDIPAVGTFYATFKVREVYGSFVIVIADGLQHGQSGMTITDGGGGSFTASIDWDPPIDAILGYYDLECTISDGIDQVTDIFANNADNLLLTSATDNIRPIVPSNNTYASPGAIERIGANPTTIGAIFTDADAAGVSAFKVSMKLRAPNDVTEIVLADNVVNGAGGVTISDLGAGVYEATVLWDPGDAQELGYYDLYFHVTDNIDTSFDGFSNNLDQLQLYDAISNNVPTLIAGATAVLPASVNRIGSEFASISCQFADIDLPGKGAFTITIKVRDQLSTEYTLVNAAKHNEQGLRIRHLDGANYEASFLWDADVSQAIDNYDLYFYIEDNNAGSVTDNYGDNLTELAVTSSALAGDGNLLRRTHEDASCGGVTSGCHNLPGHNGYGCLDCHTPHATKNIFLIRETITTPSSGDLPVDFRTRGIGDVNNPDPTPGIWSGAMADSTDNVFTGICEVCHEGTVGHHRNDGSQPGPNHNDATMCAESCHPHADGFAVSGGGESSGGQSCTCHSAIYNLMDSSSILYRHILLNTDADYSPGTEGMYANKNCLTCHVDHDIFRPDLNTGIGQRGKNLRVDWFVDPIQGDNSVLSNSDYSSSDNGGICLSCHGDTHAQGTCSGCHSDHKGPSTFAHQFLKKTDFDAATATHNYSVPTTFASDGSTFNANCIKCHNDNMTSSYQNSTYKFSLHGSPFNDLLDSAGIPGATDPLEEQLCFKCHSTTSNPNAGSNLDFYGVQSMSNQSSLDIESAFTRTYTHPTLTYSGRHSKADSALSLSDGNRHAECNDCHDPHAAGKGTHDGSSNLVSNSLKGTWGVEPTSWPTVPTPSDNANVFAAPSGYTKMTPATKEYQICLKCHSNYVTLPSGSPNIAEEINPNYPSSHAIVQAGDNAFCNTTTMNEPWGTNKINYCSDCHRSDTSTDPEGPHGSNADHLLVATIVSNSTVGTPLCDVCHKATVYWSDDANPSKFTDHPSSKGAHKGAPGCFGCHMWDYSSTASLGLPTNDWPGGWGSSSSMPPPIKIWIHGQNRKWVYNELDGSAGSGQPVENFINGYIADMDHGANRCWSDICKNHSNKGY